MLLRDNSRLRLLLEMHVEALQLVEHVLPPLAAAVPVQSVQFSGQPCNTIISYDLAWHSAPRPPDSPPPPRHHAPVPLPPPHRHRHPARQPLPGILPAAIMASPKPGSLPRHPCSNTNNSNINIIIMQPTVLQEALPSLAHELGSPFLPGHGLTST